jgi:plastocyanin
MRKKLVAFGTAIGVAALPLIAATPASEATFSVVVSCPPNDYDFSPSSVTAGVGDTIQVSLQYPGETLTVAATGATGPTSIANGATETYTVTSASGGSLTFSGAAAGNCLNKTGTLTINAGGGGSSSDSSSGPEAAMQQFGKPDSMTCDEAQPEGLNWSGVPSGGWGESWAQWMNAGNGGTVCTREIVYRAGSWVIN